MATSKTEPVGGWGYLMCGWNGCDTYFQTLADVIDPETGEPVLNPETGEPEQFWDQDADSKAIWDHAEKAHPEMFES